METWRMRWAGHMSHMGNEKYIYKSLVRKPEGKRPLGRRSYTWEFNIELNLKEVGCEGLN
jgi:hypothetical protein